MDVGHIERLVRGEGIEMGAGKGKRNVKGKDGKKGRIEISGPKPR